MLRAAIAERLRALGLELHPEKTKVVYCKDANRRGEAEHTSFDFLGYTFRGRLARGRRGFFVSFLPAMSARRGRRRVSRSGPGTSTVARGTDLSGIAKDINPQVRGWINYYGVFYRSELFSLMRRIDEHLVRWAMHKFKRFRGKPAPGMEVAGPVRQRRPTLFAHWHLLDHPTPVCGSRMTGDCHVRFCESGRGRFPPATHQAACSENVHVAVADFDGEEHVDPLEGDGAVDVEEVHGQHAGGLRLQEPSP